MAGEFLPCQLILKAYTAALELCHHEGICYDVHPAMIILTCVVSDHHRQLQYNNDYIVGSQSLNFIKIQLYLKITQLYLKTSFHLETKSCTMIMMVNSQLASTYSYIISWLYMHMCRAQLSHISKTLASYMHLINMFQSVEYHHHNSTCSDSCLYSYSLIIQEFPSAYTQVTLYYMMWYSQIHSQLVSWLTCAEP